GAAPAGDHGRGAGLHDVRRPRGAAGVACWTGPAWCTGTVGPRGRRRGRRGPAADAVPARAVAAAPDLPGLHRLSRPGAPAAARQPGPRGPVRRAARRPGPPPGVAHELPRRRWRTRATPGPGRGGTRVDDPGTRRAAGGRTGG